MEAQRTIDQSAAVDSNVDLLQSGDSELSALIRQEGSNQNAIVTLIGERNNANVDQYGDSNQAIDKRLGKRSYKQYPSGWLKQSRLDSSN